MATKRFSAFLVCLVRAAAMLLIALSVVAFTMLPAVGGSLRASAQASNRVAADWGAPFPGWQQLNPDGFGDGTTGITALEVFQGHLYAGASNWSIGGQVWRLNDYGTWQPVSLPGFGLETLNPANPAIIDMAVFNGQLYACTGWDSASGQIWRSADGKTWKLAKTFDYDEDVPEWNITAVTNLAVFKGMLYAGTGSAAANAQVWRSISGNPGSWKQVAPASDAPYFPGNVTGFAVFNGALYAAVESSYGAPPQVWRSLDGSHWTTVIGDGFGISGNVSLGGFAEFNNRLYLGARNDSPEYASQIWRTSDGIHWQMAVGGGFGDPNNIKVESLRVFGENLYAATNNPYGMQVWRSGNGVNWQQVVPDGFGDSYNTSTLWDSATIVFQGKYLIGTWNDNGGQLWMFTP